MNCAHFGTQALRSCSLLQALLCVCWRVGVRSTRVFNVFDLTSLSCMRLNRKTSRAKSEKRWQTDNMSWTDGEMKD